MAIPEDDRFRRDDYERENPGPPSEKSTGWNEWLLVVALVLVLVVAVAVGFTVHAQRAQQRLSMANARLAAELTQTQNQLTSLADKLKAMTAMPMQPMLPTDEKLNSPAERSTDHARHQVRHAHSRPAPPKWQRQMQAQLSSNQQRIVAAEQAIAKTQSDLAANADSARNSLNGLGGSIARDHTELVELEKLGQRNYYEFDLFKSKRFEREGPISLELRHTNTKQRNYDVELLVNDSKLSKKHVSLYEPIVLDTAASSQPLELVVNQIDKNHIHGYVSVPKTYTERASASPAPSVSQQFSLTPAPAGAAQPAAATSQTAVQPSPELTSNPQP